MSETVIRYSSDRNPYLGRIALNILESGGVGDRLGGLLTLRKPLEELEKFIESSVEGLNIDWTTSYSTLECDILHTVSWCQVRYT